MEKGNGIWAVTAVAITTTTNITIIVNATTSITKIAAADMTIAAADMTIAAADMTIAAAVMIIAAAIGALWPLAQGSLSLR